MSSQKILSAEDAQALREKFAAENARRNNARSFASFVKLAWPYVPQCEPLVWSWHMEALCMHAEALARGEMNWLAVNVPPGHSKSSLWCVLLPSWIWSWWPKCQMIFGSYSHSFAIRDSRRTRDVIQSDWYQENFCRPQGWNLKYEAADNLVNSVGGTRLATSVAGVGAGMRAHAIIIDDPVNTLEAQSKVVRDEAVDWMSQTLSQRFVGGYSPRFALVMQRLHEEDPTTWVLRQKNAQHLCLPSEYEPESPCVTHTFTDGEQKEFWRDPRTQRGDLLFPALYPRERIEGDKLKLGDFGFAAQHQQRPAPIGGGLFKVENWRFWSTDDITRRRIGMSSGGVRPRGCYEGGAQIINLDDLETILISVDATFRETSDGSFVAIHVWGKNGAYRYLLDAVHRRMDFTDTVKALLGVISRWPEARRKLIEGKANGDAIISTLEKAHGVSGLEAVPASRSKLDRAHAMQPYQSAANVFLPDGVPWLEEYIAEFASFPKGRSDDHVDAQSQALQGLEQARTTMAAWMDAGID